MYGPAEVDTRSSKNTAGTPAGSRNRELAGQILRFGVTGVLNTSICLVILFVLNERYGVDEWIASFIGYAVATVHSFIVSNFWTFAGQHELKAHHQFIAFVLLNVIGAVMLSTGVHLFTPVLCLRTGSLFPTAFALVLHFIGSRSQLFRWDSGRN